MSRIGAVDAKREAASSPRRSPDLTEQQHRAVYLRDASIVLSSGAGCGKTHVLTERYLSHLSDDGAEVSQIVAITFTERAAREMRQRIRKEILRHVQEAASAEDADRWARHLRGLETAQISTIHAFCAALLRQHAVEAGLDPHFAVLEDVLSVNLESEALLDCLQRLLTEATPAGEDLCDLVRLYGWQPVLQAVQHLLRGWDEQPWKAWRQKSPEALATDWQDYARNQLLPRYVEYLTAGSPKIARCLWFLRSSPPKPGSKMAANVALILEQTPRMAEARDLTQTVAELIEAAKVSGERAKAWSAEAVYEAAKEFLKGFREELKAEQLERFVTAVESLPEAVAVGQRFLRVAEDAAQTYRRLKHLEGAVDFQDLLVLARDLLRDHQEVRERAQRRFRYLLIDELQDTDPVQMELVHSLCGAELTSGKLFTVGDHSQSIYRFRGANVHLFRELRQSVPHEGRLGLTVNFRSQPAILHFTNALLSHRLEDYESLVAFHRQVNPGPCVEFLWSPRGPKENVTEARSHEADWIARRIAALVQGEKLIVDRPAGHTLRPVKMGDVVLLFRAMTNVHLYEAALRHHGLDYYLVGGRAFFAQQEIYDLLNLLRTLENPQDAVSLAGTLRSPFCCLSDEALFVLSRHKDGLWAGLFDAAIYKQLPEDQRGPTDRARRHLQRWHGLKDQLSIAHLLGEVFADSGYDASMQFETLGDRKLANLWKLMEIARTFDRSARFGLAEFIQRLGDMVRTQPREEQAATQPEQADVVRLMSIHQAKGLEFPVVFIPDVSATGGGGHLPVAHWDANLGCVTRPPTDEEPPPFPDFGWQLWQAQEAVEEWHEDLRTLYVACTRAQDYLVLSASVKQPISPGNSWMLTLAERFDLNTGRCLVDGLAPDCIPQVRVLQSLEAFSQSVPIPLRGKTLLPSASSALLPAIAPLAPCLAGKRIFTVREVERYLALELPVPQHRLRSCDFAYQFDAEDGSDRKTWLLPQDRLTGQRDATVPVVDSVLRTVLEHWEYRNPDDWRPILSQALQTQTEAQRLQQELEPHLRCFADSETRKQLADAKTCYRNLEFVLDSPGWSGRFLRGMLDCLWQDEQGRWHLLAFTAESVPSAEREAYWQSRRVGLTLSAWAVQRKFGAWPQSVTLYLLHEGAALHKSGRILQQSKVLAAVDKALKEIAGLLLSD